nr:MAG TPA: minor tail protein [Caudoviricetes sp.]
MAGDYKIAIKIAGQLEKSFGSAINGAKSGFNALGKLGKIGATEMAASAAAIGAVTVASVNVGREFESAMSSTAATAGATGEDYNKLRDAAMEMGRKTSKTATESAQALEYMSLAGWTVQQSITGLPSVLRLSEATGLDLARTSDLVTDSMSACGVTVDGLAGFLDVCAKANNKSNQTAEQLMEAYIGVGGTMKNLNVPITESATALGVLANRGIKGSEAGNALNAIMVNLTTGTGQAGKMMESLGISAFDSQGKFVGLEGTLQLLNGKLQGLTEEQRNAALAAIGGKQHVDALNDLMSGLNTTTSEGVSEWEALDKELNNASGSLDTMAQMKLDNLNGDFAIFQSALEDTGIKIYDNLNAPLREATQFGTDMVYQLSDALASGGFDGFVGEIGNVLSEVILKIAEYAPQVLDMATSMVMSFASGIQSNSGKIAEGAVEIGSSLLSGIIQIIPQLIITGADLIAKFAQGAAQRLPELINMGVEGIQNIVSGINANLPTIISSAVIIIGSLLQGLMEASPSLIQGAIQAISVLLQGLISVAPMLISSGMQFIMMVLQGLVAAAPMIVQGALQLIAMFIQGIAALLPNIIPMGIQLIYAILDGFISGMGSVGEAVGQLAFSLVEAIFSTDWITLGLDIIEGIVNGVWEGIKGFGKGVWEGIKGWFTGEETDMSGAGQEFSSSFADGVNSSSAAHTAAEYQVNSTIQGYSNANLSGANTAGLQVGNSYLDGLTTSVPGINTTAFQIGTGSVDSLNESLLSSQNTLNLNAMQMGTSTVGSLETGMNMGMTGVTNTAQTAATDSIMAMQDGISSGAEQIKITVQDLSTSISDSLKTCFEGVNTDALTNWNGLTTQIQTSATNITTAVIGMKTKVNSTFNTIEASGKAKFSSLGIAIVTSAITTSTTMTTLWNSAKASLIATWQSLSGGFASAWSSVHATAVSMALSTAAAIKSAFENMTITIPRPKIPKVDVSFRKVGDGKSEVNVPDFSVSYFAKGGIMQNPTMFGMNGMSPMVGGEAGPEAILPLTTLWEKLKEIVTGIFDSKEIGKDSGVSKILDYFNGGETKSNSIGTSDTSKIEYSPVYNFYGQSPSQQDIYAAGKMSQDDFDKMMREWARNNERVAF